jgi:hypothetical protein
VKTQCGECGVPLIVSKTHEWRDGCIVSKDNGAANLCLYEASFHNALIDKAGEILGIPLDPLIYNAGRHASEEVVKDLFSAHPFIAKLAVRRPFIFLSERVLFHFGRSIGTGSYEILEQKLYKHVKLRMREPYHPWHCLAIMAGAVQYLTKVPFTYTATEEDDCLIVDITFLREEKEEEEAYLRLTSADLSPKKESERFVQPRCPSCTAPAEIGKLLSFDLERGVITERESGERMILLGVYSLNAILRELEKELGYDFDDLFIKLERKNFARKLGENLKDAVQWGEKPIYDHLALRGLGTLREMVERDGKASLTIENTFIPPIVVGRLLALWEREYQKEGSYEFGVSGNTLQLSIS